MAAAIGNATSASYVQQMSAQRVTSGKDADGDNDGSKVGEVEKSATQQPKLSSTATVGTVINTSA